MRASSAASAAAVTFAGLGMAFDANAKTNVVTYWGQGAGQDSLLSYCANPNIDIINIGFVNVFPDQGKAGWPGTNFGNACGSETYTHNNMSTQLLSNCPDIGPDIVICQNIYGTKILLSIGGATADGYNVDDSSAQNFANFLWGSFGPVLSEWTSAGGPRPFGDAVVDGFDFDIESELSSAPTYKGETISDYKTRGWASMVNTFRSLFAQDTTKTYYLSAAPQCEVPDEHLSTVVANAWFDFLFVQFYNTAECSARSALSSAKRATGFAGYDNWASASSYNPNVKIYLGLAASKESAVDDTYYLEPSEVDTLVDEIYGNSKFGGIMLWQASTAENNVICNKDYATWMKQILDAQAEGTTINTETNPCPAQPISQEGLCGGYNGQTCVGSIFGSCCSIYGYCGDSSSYCSAAACDPKGGNCGNEYIGVVSPASASNSSSSTSANTTTSSTTSIVGTVASAGLPTITSSANGTYNNGTGALAGAVNANLVSTKTIYTTEVFTIMSCAPTVTDCPARTKTSTYAIGTSLVTQGAFATGPADTNNVASTKTIYSTEVFTITSCAPEVTDCPARPESQTVVTQTSTYALTTTVITGAAFASSSPVSESESTTTTVTTVRATSTIYRTVIVSSSTVSAVQATSQSAEASSSSASSSSSSSTLVQSVASVPVAINIAPYALSNSTSTQSYPTAGTISSSVVVQVVTATVAPVQLAQVSHFSSGVASATLAHNMTASNTLPAAAYFTGAANRAEYGMGAIALAVGALLAL